MKCCRNCKYWTDKPNPDSDPEWKDQPVNDLFKFCYVEAGVKRWEEAKEARRRSITGMTVLSISPVIHFRGDSGQDCNLFQANEKGQLTIFDLL